MTEMSERRGVLFDLQPLWLDAVQRILEGVDVEVVDATTSAAEALEMVAKYRPDIFLLDISQEPDGLAMIRRARELSPGTRVVALGTDDQASSVSEAFYAGAIAYILKTVHPADLASAVRQAFSHSVYFADSPVRRAPEPVPEVPDVALTRREVEILRLAAEGHSNVQLARMLWVTEQTVKFHLSNIYRKLDVSNRTEASRWAQVHGLLASDSADRDEQGPQAGQGVLTGLAS
jgi:DNA-binding NarL/FixJ family response regulator